MPVVYRFRVTFEDYDEVHRDIEIKSIQTFLELHQTIQSSIGFDNQKPASFFMSNDNWVKGQEISLGEKLDKDGNKTHLMESSRLCDYIADPHQKILYLSDYDANWSFMIELVKIIPQGDALRNYPVCVKSIGDAPKQYVVVPAPKAIAAEDDEFGKLMDVLADDEETDDDSSEEKDDILGDTEDGVEMDEIQGMSEEGEEEESEEGEGEMDYNDAEEDDQKDDY
ncbi:MAG: hypothetical protein U0Y08_03070 [Bacteroidia bacterium]